MIARASAIIAPDAAPAARTLDSVRNAEADGEAARHAFDDSVLPLT